MPLPLLLILMTWGLVSLLRHKYAAGKMQLAVSVIFLVAMSMPFLPNYLLGKLESKYPQYDRASPASLIVVLGASHTNDGALPITSRLGRASLYRVNEAMRIAQFNPGSQIVLTGGAVYNDLATSVANESMLLSLGMSEQRVKVIDSEAKDTHEEANALYTKLKAKSFVLVTSASHMPRAMAEFEALGLHPIAAPTDHLVKKAVMTYWWTQGPSPDNIHKLNMWWYETLATTWMNIRL